MTKPKTKSRTEKKPLPNRSKDTTQHVASDGLRRAMLASPPVAPVNPGEQPAVPNDAPTNLEELQSADDFDGKKQGELFLKEDLTIADGHLNQCERVHRIWDAPDKQLDIFCATTKIRRDGSKLRIFKLIGGKVERLRHILPALPPEWKKIYEIARLEDNEFERVSKDPRLHPEITGKELAAIIAKEPGASPNTPPAGTVLAPKPLKLTLDFAGLSPADAVRVYRDIVTLSETESFKVSASAALQELIDAAAK